MPDEIKMDRRVFEALASETRINILKKLDTRQMTVTELSRELDMAKSSIHEHLAKMVDSGLVEKFDDGHKWTYYYLARKGRNILHPHETAKILVLLGISLLAIAGGITNIWNLLMATAAAAPMASKTGVIEAAPAYSAPPDYEMAAPSEAPRAVEHALPTAEPSLLIGAVLILAGIFIGFLAYKMWSRTKPKRFKQSAR